MLNISTAKRFRAFTLLLILFFYSLPQGRAQSMDSLKVNRIHPKLSSNGVIGYNPDNPENSPVTYTSNNSYTLFSNALWISGYGPQDTIHLAAMEFMSDSVDDHFYPGPVADQYNNTYDQRYNQVWRLDRDSVEYHAQNWWKGGYQMPEMIAEWPAHGDTSNGEAYELAPYEDRNDNGKYDPENGDRPIIRGDHALYFIANDVRGPYSGTEMPFKIEIHGMLYAWDCPSDPALNNSFFMHYEVINRSSVSYDSLLLGSYNDMDIGCNEDDYLGTDVERGILFSYNGDDFDGGCSYTNGFGDIPTAFGLTFLKGPQVDPNGVDDQLGGAGYESVNGIGFGDGLVDNESFGMQRAYYAPQNPSSPLDPIFPEEYYNYMIGWANDSSTAFRYYDPSGTGPRTRFSVPWDSDPQNYATEGQANSGFWSEDSVSNPPGDRRGIATTGPVTLDPGDTMTLDAAYVAAQDPSDTVNTAAVPILKERVDSLRSYFLDDAVPCSDGSFTSVEEAKEEAAFDVEVYPNPSKGRFHVELESETRREYRYALYSMRGELIDEGNWQGGGKRTLELGDEKQGVYFLRIRSEQGAKVMKLVKE